MNETTRAAQEEKSCEARVGAHLEGRLTDLRAMWTAEQDGNEEGPEDLGPLNEYGLCFDYVPAEEPEDEDEEREDGYFRYQLSWGGPGDEFRFFCDIEGQPYRIEYWFLDWFDGASRRLHGEDKAFMLELFDWMTAGDAQEMVRRELEGR